MARRVAVCCVTDARPRGERPRTERFFRDIHGAEYTDIPNVVLVHRGGNAAGDDDVHRRHWAVVCADRRGARVRGSGRRACIAAAPTGCRATPTSPTSPAPSPTASAVAPRSSAPSCSTPASIATPYPMFCQRPRIGGVIDRYPNVNQHWTGDNVGDLYLGAKINLWSESRQNPAAIALRGMIKVPTGKSDVGVSTGKADFLARLHRQQGSGEAGRSLRLRRLRVARQAGRLRHAGRRVPVGRRRRLPVAQHAARHRRVERLRAVQRHDDDPERHDAARRRPARCRRPCPTPRTSRARRSA